MSHCPACKGRDYLVCEGCGAHFLTIERDHRNRCFDCREAS